MTRIRRLTLAALVAALPLAASGAIAQINLQRPPNDPLRPLIVTTPAEPAARTSKPVTPLDRTQLQVVRQATMLRQAGRFADARKTLAALPAELLSHPIVLMERARTDLGERRYDDVVRLATLERRTQKDSLLLGEELTAAYEGLSRWREASLTAVEVWVAGPAESEWAGTTLLRLSAKDPRSAREGLKRAVAADPSRADLAAGLAALEWRAGNMKSALQTLGGLERAERGPRQRWGFGENLLLMGTARDSTGALDVFLDVAADKSQDPGYRQSAGRRYWQLQSQRNQANAAAGKLYQAMKDLTPEQWGGDLAIEVARTLRGAGDTSGARALLGPATDTPAAPDVALERSLADLRDGPPERVLASLLPGENASDEQKFRYAEAAFFAGVMDSASIWYQHVADNPTGEHAGAALERLYLIEDAKASPALPVFGRIAYEQWRGAGKRALALAESLYTRLPRGPLWAQATMVVVDERERAGDASGAVTAALAVADSLPNDRLAPLARQRAGELYAGKLHEDAKAIQQYEECVARYPRAWNAPEVRRRLESLRRSRRF